MRVATELRAIDLRSSHRFEDEIAAASSENLVLINKTEFSIRTPLHFKFRLVDLPSDAGIMIVEGVLKADVLSAIHPELYIVATPCVTANHAALVELARSRLVWIGFDQDRYSNETVCFHLASLVARRLRREKTLATTRIASWDATVKGIDDAAVRNFPITSISVQQWLDRLSPRFRQIAMTRLYEITAIPLRAKNISGSQRQ